MFKYVKSALVAMLLATLLVGSFTGTRVLQDYTSFNKPRSYTVLLISEHGSGSGVVLAPGLVLTAAHVTGPKGEGFTINGQPIKVLSYNRSLDLSLVEVRGVDCPCAPLGTLPTEDSRLVAVGYPLDAGQFATEGRMQGINPQRSRLLASTPIIFGNSGGGLFAFQGGEWRLVGLTVEVAGANLGFIGVPVPHIMAAVPITNIMEWLHDRSGYYDKDDQ